MHFRSNEILLLIETEINIFIYAKIIEIKIKLKEKIIYEEIFHMDVASEKSR
jgi:hypothetical protein